MTMLVVTHRWGFARELQTVVVMADGEMIEDENQIAVRQSKDPHKSTIDRYRTEAISVIMVIAITREVSHSLRRV
jgi:ABC-type polar amino acid transport system ATPase subunit